MESILSVLGVCVISVWCHRLLHIHTRKKNSIGMRVVSVYGIGFFGLAALLLWFHSTTFFSSLVLYSCISASISFLYLGVVLGGEAPSSMILRALKARHSMSKSEILSLFTEDQLVWKRIEDLRTAGLVIVQMDHISATQKGILCAHVIALYESAFHRKERG